ncbi:MAG TPA: winged helix-turn-helix transcriptional regulator, partial [Candidatus Thermoplasmatota archaeon]|nr:winged helix-turn-helix transcriptional regulator [Candidatus Thermoplasmatota archaeon]
LWVAGRREGVLLVDQEDLRLDGAVHAALGAPSADGARPLAVEGRVGRVLVDGADVTPRLAPPVRDAGGGVLALLALALLGRLVVAPLYHRLGPSDVLANANRRRIYEAVRARPGASVVELVAAVGLSRILVRHHLKMLEAHKLVRATVWRRRRTYAVAGSEAGRAACELKDATRRRVAAALARAGRATQKQLAQELGISQRLVSYHLARLEASALVRAEGKAPRTYVATDVLVLALAREEGAAAASGATAA